MADSPEFTARMSAVKFAEELADEAASLRLDAYTAGWDDDRLSVSAADFALLLKNYKEASDG